MKVVSVVGARPQFVKLAPIAAAFAETDPRACDRSHRSALRRNLSDVFFAGLGIPAPDVHLGVGSGSHGVQTGPCSPPSTRCSPSYGPTGSSSTATPTPRSPARCRAVKQHLPVAHLEAGCGRSTGGCRRSTTASSPTTPRIYCWRRPTRPCDHLADEGLATRSVLVGDVMVDVCLRVRDAVRAGQHTATAATRGIDPAEPYLRRHPAPGREHRRPGSPRRSGRRIGRAAPTGGAAGPSAARGPCRGFRASSWPRARCTSVRRWPTRPWSPPCSARPASSPTPADCRKRPSCWSARARRSGPRPSGSRRSAVAGTAWCRIPGR